MQPNATEMAMTESPWERYWSSDANRDWWKKPAPEVVELAKAYTPATHPKVLDMGCGVGRHALMFAAQGYEVTATDESPSAIGAVKEETERLGLSLETVMCEMSKQPFDPGSFDLVLAYNVIYHGRRSDFADAISHVANLLRPQGIFYFTAPTRKDAKYGCGTQVEEHAYESPNSVTPGDLHYFPDQADFEELLSGFNVLKLGTDEGHWENQGASQFYSNWQVLVEKI
jgi:2-polyprenyl-3-methyl-5-hydroxy-6-metoxy-1,4-benzoquinol methylase